jgi:DNA helicase IV
MLGRLFKVLRVREDNARRGKSASLENSSLGERTEFAGIKLVTNLDDWRRGKGPLVTSLFRFKGLEADALILVDVVPPDRAVRSSRFKPEHFYVACSRAKHLLTIISRAPLNRSFIE